MNKRRTHTARLLRNELLSEPAQCKHLEFEVEELDNFEFQPGQFVSAVAMNGEKQITRAYSIASGPRGNKRFDVCVNRVPGGFFSNYLCDMKDGDTVQFHGPHGHFVLRNPARDGIMIATGTGVAPMRAFVEHLFGSTPRHEGKEFWLVYGTRYPTETYYREYFEEIASKFPNFHYIATVSRPTDGWTGERGYVQEKVKAIVEGRAGMGKDQMDAYICGLNDMVAANRALLGETFQWDKKQIVFERYD